MAQDHRKATEQLEQQWAEKCEALRAEYEDQIETLMSEKYQA